MSKIKNETVRKAALDFHEFPKPGKLEIRATKPLANQSDLAKAYSPGVAEACLEIKKDFEKSGNYTSKSNLVGSNPKSCVIFSGPGGCKGGSTLVAHKNIPGFTCLSTSLS